MERLVVGPSLRARRVESLEEREERQGQLEADLQSWQERFAQWVEAEGEEFGINIQKPDAPPEEKK